MSGSSDRRHEVPPPELGEHPGVDPVGLGRERGKGPGPGRIGDEDIPAGELEGVVDEMGAVHRFDDRGHLLTGPCEPADEILQRPPLGRHRSHRDRLACFVEHVHIDLLARQVQSRVQHPMGLLVTGSARTHDLTTEARLHDIQM